MLSRVCAIAVVALAATLAFAPGVSAESAHKPPVSVTGGGGGGTGGTGTVTTTITNTKTGGATAVVHGGAGVGVGNNSTTAVPDPCQAVPLQAQDATMPWWNGHTSAQGQLVHWVCTSGAEPLVKVPFFLANGTAPAPLPPDPAVLAREAMAQVLTLIPAPAVDVSPDLKNNVDKVIGQPVTYVNLWFWFWAESDVWQDYSNTVTLNGVSATTTAHPTSLVYDPGDGDAPVVCATQGRPWTDADANYDPATVGGCGYRYLTVTPGAPITGRLTINWQVSWTSNVGAAGVLDPLATSTDTPPFVVEQIEVVTR